MKTLFLVVLLSISANSFADNTTFRLSAPFKGLYINYSADGTLNNGQGGSIPEHENPECDNPENIGYSDFTGQCGGKIIVDNEMLRQLVESEGDYSDETIYTGQVTDISALFSSRTPIHSISGWDTSNVTDMSYTFSRSNPPYDITKWDTSSVTNMTQMFSYAYGFNQDISDWDTSNVTSMLSMFNRATDFNQNISQWDTSKVTNFSGMFYKAHIFNQDIGNWNVESASNMGGMFGDAYAFSADLSNWCVSKVTNKPDNFAGASNLENTSYPKWGFCPAQSVAVTEDCLDPQNINKIGIAGACNGKVIVSNSLLKSWVRNEVDYSDAEIYTGQVSSFNGLFSGITPIYSISNWDTSNVKDMSATFYRSNPFYDITSWDTSNVTNMYQMFTYAYEFNQDISKWDTSNVTNMTSMFNRAVIFNHDIGNWDVSNVTSMNAMFYSTHAFDHDLNGWCVTSFTSEPSGFSDGSALTSENKPLWGTCP